MNPLPDQPTDIKAGQLTYGQRLELGGILANKDEVSEFEVFNRTIECLYGRRPQRGEYKHAVRLFESAIDGMAFWVKVEAEQLKYTPSQEEKDAGVERYSAEVGELGTAYDIAKEYKIDPDEVLGWKYGKVFGHLRKRKAEYDYQKRYDKVMERRAKNKH